MLSEHDIDDLAKKAITEWDIPGLGLAIVHNGKPLRVCGYGTKKRGSPDPVTEKTVFQIASLTKAFTAATVGMLVEEGKLEWEKPIKDYLPSFQLKDQYAAHEMTLRDLLSHRTGLPGTSKECWRLWYHTGRSTEDLIQRLQYVDPAYSFRSHYSYNNMAYVVVSKVVEKVSGMPWTQFCEKRIFAPLGMSRTNLSYHFLTHDSNVASAHLIRSLQERPIPWENWECMAAAGGINSSATDMAAWLLYCLSSPKALTDALKPQTLMEPEGFLDPIIGITWPIYAHEQKFVSYGFGWGMYSLCGKAVFFHFGMVDGIQSFLAIVPEEQLGIAILTNQAPHQGAVCLTNELLDRFLHCPSIAWHEKGHAAMAEMNRSLETQKAMRQEIKHRREPTLPLEAYLGTYEHPAYGTLCIALDNGQLTITLWTQEKGALKAYDEDTFEVHQIPSAAMWTLSFEKSEDKKQIQALKIPDLGVFVKKTSL